MAFFALRNFRYFTLLFAFGQLAACSSYKPLQQNNIRAVYVLYKDTSYYHPNGYILDDSSVVYWGKQLIGIAAGLEKNRHRYKTLKKQGSGYLTPLFKDKAHWRYVPIKVIGLTEFGYIELKNEEVIYYGIMGTTTFIDITNKRVYGDR